MKRYIFLLLLVLHFCKDVTAQKGQPAFGKIDKADLEMVDCEFDRGADACKLIDRAEVYYDRGSASFFKLVTERRVRIKIFKDAGMNYANVKIPYISRNKDEDVRNIDAYTYNLDASGNIAATRVDRKSIYSQQLDKSHSQYIIAFPEVKPGSVIEYKYTHESEYIYYIDDYYFQDEIPVRFSQFELRAPLILRFKEDQFIYTPIDKKEEITDDLINTNSGVARMRSVHKILTMKNLPGIHDEPYMSSKNDYMQRIGFQLSQIDYGDGNIVDMRTTWTKMAEEMDKDPDFGEELRKTVPGAHDIIEKAARCNNPECKIATIYNYVRSQMNWNGTYSKFAMQGIRTAWDKKSGSLGDINIILYSLLKEAGITVLPLLVSTRDNGIINQFYTSEKQFNAVMVYAESGDKSFVMNAADKYNPYNLIPYDVINTSAFLVDGEQSQFITLTAPNQRFKQFIAIQGDVDSAGIMKGESVVTSSGYAKNPRCKAWLEDQEAFKTKYFTRSYTAVKIDDIQVSNLNNDSMGLEQKVKFTLPLNSSGEYRYFTVNLFTGLEKNPFVTDERITDVDFGYGQDYVIFGNFYLPDGYTFDELPKNFTMIMPDTSIIMNRVMELQDNALTVRITLQFKRPWYAARNYPEFQDFYKKLYAKLNEQVVIKKK